MSELSEKENRLRFRIAGNPAKVGVIALTLRETVSAPYQADLVLASEETIALSDAVGQEGLLTVVGASTDRLVHGVISRFAQTGQRGRFLLYEARLVPPLWLLSQKRDSRIFQDSTVNDIIGKVLKDGQIPADHAAFRLKEKYAAKEYAVQYQESDLSWVSRLAEEDGIWFFFEQSKDKDVVVFADSPSAYKPIEGDAAIVFKQAEGMPPKEEVVYHCTVAESIVPGKITQTDFDQAKPSTSLATEKEGAANQTLEVYEHPGRYLDEDAGKRLTKTRLEELSAMQETAQGLSTCPRLAPGYTFTLQGHATSAFNQEYLIVSVIHHGKEPQVLQETATVEAQTYYNEFVAVPSSVNFRPPRATPRPVIAGSQTAMVVGPKGEEIYTDKEGRIKIKFHWDRVPEKNEKSSCWIRVSQAWAGEGWGAMFIPRIGQEVIVSFLDGDPDRPIITGRVYNGANPPPHALPANKTKSTIKSNSSKGGGGSNELTFEDAKGQEKITMHAQKDLAVNVGNNKNESVGADESHSVGSNETHSVGANEKHTVGSSQTLSVSSNRTKSVGANENNTIGGGQTNSITGNQTTSVQGNTSESVAGSESSSVTGSRTHTTQGAKTETVALACAETIGLAKALSVGAAYQVSVAGAMNESVGLVKAEQVGALKAVTVGGSMTESVKGTRSMKTVGGHSISAKEISLEAVSSITIKVGGASIGMKSDGTIEINGKKLNVKGSDACIDASGKLTLTGKPINHN